MKKGAILDMKGARLGNKKVRNWVMKKTHKKGARLGKKGAKMDKSLANSHFTSKTEFWPFFYYKLAKNNRIAFYVFCMQIHYYYELK